MTTVRELITQLQGCDPDLPVFMRDAEEVLGSPNVLYVRTMHKWDARWTELPVGTRYLSLTLDY